MANCTYITIRLLATVIVLFIMASDTHAGLVDYFTTEPGTMPLILCAPHGGTEDLPGVTDRTSGLLQPDVNTDLIAIGLFKEIQKLTNKRPYLVVAKIKRDDIDFNRPIIPEHEPFGGWERAFADRSAEKYWRFYHATISDYLNAVFLHAPPDQLVLLLDIHGHARRPGTEDVLIFGDEYGDSTVPLLERYGPAAVEGPGSIMGLMASKGYRVRRNMPEFEGGYTVRTYSGPRTAAMLIEIPVAMRTVARLREAFIRDFAEAIVTFLRTYSLGCFRSASPSCP